MRTGNSSLDRCKDKTTRLAGGAAFPLDADMTLERVMGIEPTYAAWEAAVLPLNYTRLAIEFNSAASRDRPSLRASRAPRPRGQHA
jgi:hypothetical protein